MSWASQVKYLTETKLRWACSSWLLCPTLSAHLQHGAVQNDEKETSKALCKNQLWNGFKRDTFRTLNFNFFYSIITQLHDWKGNRFCWALPEWITTNMCTLNTHQRTQHVWKQWRHKPPHSGDGHTESTAMIWFYLPLILWHGKLWFMGCLVVTGSYC